MRTALLLFGFGLALRTLFWLATGDRLEVHAAAFQGDAAVWQELARAAAAGADHELLRLPLRPPAMHWLVAALWDGDPATAWRLRLVFAVLGALVAPLVWLLLRRHLAPGPALLAGVLCAAASNLLALGSGPHNELPYLVLVLLSLLDQERLRLAPTTAVAARWGALHALLCLLRAEHALTFLAFVAVLPLQRAPRWRRSAATALAACALALVPWHAVAWSRVAAYNATGAPALPPAGVAAPGGLPWDDGALARLGTAPAFQQGPVYRFVTDTVRARGGTAVTAGDLDVVREAYDTWPRPIGRPFVCLYGGLNFFLANSPESDGGFSGAVLDRRPPLHGGLTRYPPGLLQVLPPPGQLVLSYPPHLGHLLDGYRDGLQELAADPGDAAARLGRKLGYAAEGAASGLGGYALPIGLSGLRRPVDLVTAEGAFTAVYRVALLLLAAAGLWSLRRQPWLWPWLLLLATRLLVVAAFFGYARQGALCVPVVALGVATAPLLRRLGTRPIWLLAGLLLLLEGARALTTEVALTLPDGTPATGLAADDCRAVRVLYR